VNADPSHIQPGFQLRSLAVFGNLQQLPDGLGPQFRVVYLFARGFRSVLLYNAIFEQHTHLGKTAVLVLLRIFCVVGSDSTVDEQQP